MKLTVTSDVLAGTLALVGQAVAKRGSLPVLYCVVLEHKDGELLVAATNLEQTIHRYLTTNASGDGAMLVPYKEFIAYMKLVPKGVSVELERDMRDALTVRFGGSTATFRGQCAADYPRLPGIFDPGPYEAIREAEKIERTRLAQVEEDRKEAEKRAERDRIAASPDVFTYRHSIMYRDIEEMTFDTIEEACKRWHDDYRGTTRGPNGEAYHGHSITDKFGEKVVSYDHQAEQIYAASRALCEPNLADRALVAAINSTYGHLHGIGVEAVASVRLDGETQTLQPTGPPPGTPCEDCGWAVAEEQAVRDVLPPDMEAEIRAIQDAAVFKLLKSDLNVRIMPPTSLDVPVTFNASEPVGVPLQQQAEQQQDELADRIERVRSFVAQSAVKAQRGPRVTKRRFALKPDTIERFFQRAIKVGATVKVSNLVKHEGNLIEYTPLYINQESFVVRFEQGEPFPVAKSNVKYLEGCF